MHFGFLLLFSAAVVYAVAGQSPLSPKNYTRTLETILENSDPRFRPNFGGPPVDVAITMYFLNILAVDHENMRFTSQLYFRQFWKDKRLAFPAKPGMTDIPLNYAGELWQPDTFIANEQRSLFHTFSLPNVFVRISSNGDVLKSERITVTATCPMNFKYFPMDTQMCQLEIESYGYNMADVKYSWRSGSNSVGIPTEAADPEFTIIGHRVKSKEIHLSGGNYSRLTVEIFFKRNYQFHIYNVYIPSMLVFVFAWFTLWMNPKTNQSRLILSISALALNLALLVAARIYSPATSYLNPLEVYMGISTLFIVWIVVHHSLVSHSLVEDDQEKDLDESGKKKKLFSFLSLEKYIRYALGLVYILFIFFYWIILSQTSSMNLSV